MTTAKAQGNYIKHQLLKQHNLTLKDFALQYGFRYDAVSDIVRGIRRGNYGVGREIVEKLTQLIGPLSNDQQAA